MVETVGGEPATSRAKPTIQVPPRGSVGFLYANGSGPGFSPGPMTLVSSFFPEQGQLSFSQLLAGAMVSPLTEKPPAYDCGKNSEGGAGRKWDRPVNLVVPPPQLQSESMNTNPLFMVPPGLSPSGLLSPLHSPFGMSHQQALAHVTAQAAFSQSFAQMQAEFQHSSCAGTAQAVANHASSARVESQMQHIDPPPPDVENSKKERSEVSSVKGAAGDKPANDGYNWRKYGQKHVKASECPRSYYKCTYPNCPIKKTVQRSLDGHISEITYKGEHNHDPPKVNKGGKDTPLLETSAKACVIADQTDTPRLIETAIVNSETDTVVVIVDDGDADEPTTKRRSLDNGQSVPSSSHQAAPESKIVLQTRSEVDLLDDGYKWRKYGQKVVKGNLHPRSYYRCTYAGCNVRKHVERASADPKSVITTYEGKHNHDLPVGKLSSSHSANAQQSQTQTSVSKSLLEMNYGSKATTLQLKDEQIMA